MEHDDDPAIDEPYVPPAGNVLEGNVDSQSPTEQPTLGDTAEGQGAVSFLGAVCTEACLTPQLMLSSDKQYTFCFT